MPNAEPFVLACLAVKYFKKLQQYPVGGIKHSITEAWMYFYMLRATEEFHIQREKSNA